MISTLLAFWILHQKMKQLLLVAETMGQLAGVLLIQEHLARRERAEDFRVQTHFAHVYAPKIRNVLTENVWNLFSKLVKNTVFSQRSSVNN